MIIHLYFKAQEERKPWKNWFALSNILQILSWKGFCGLHNILFYFPSEYSIFNKIKKLSIRHQLYCQIDYHSLPKKIIYIINSCELATHGVDSTLGSTSTAIKANEKTNKNITIGKGHSLHALHYCACYNYLLGLIYQKLDIIFMPGHMM